MSQLYSDSILNQLLGPSSFPVFQSGFGSRQAPSEGPPEDIPSLASLFEQKPSAPKENVVGRGTVPLQQHDFLQQQDALRQKARHQPSQRRSSFDSDGPVLGRANAFERMTDRDDVFGGLDRMFDDRPFRRGSLFDRPFGGGLHRMFDDMFNDSPFGGRRHSDGADGFPFGGGDPFTGSGGDPFSNLFSNLNGKNGNMTVHSKVVTSNSHVDPTTGETVKKVSTITDGRPHVIETVMRKGKDGAEPQKIVTETLASEPNEKGDVDVVRMKFDSNKLSENGKPQIATRTMRFSGQGDNLDRAREVFQTKDGFRLEGQNQEQQQGNTEADAAEDGDQEAVKQGDEQAGEETDIARDVVGDTQEAGGSEEQHGVDQREQQSTTQEDNIDRQLVDRAEPEQNLASLRRMEEAPIPPPGSQPSPHQMAVLKALLAKQILRDQIIQQLTGQLGGFNRALGQLHGQLPSGMSGQLPSGINTHRIVIMNANPMHGMQGHQNPMQELAQNHPKMVQNPRFRQRLMEEAQNEKETNIFNQNLWTFGVPPLVFLGAGLAGFSTVYLSAVLFVQFMRKPVQREPARIDEVQQTLQGTVSYLPHRVPIDNVVRERNGRFRRAGSATNGAIINADSASEFCFGEQDAELASDVSTNDTSYSNGSSIASSAYPTASVENVLNTANVNALNNTSTSAVSAYNGNGSTVIPNTNGGMSNAIGTSSAMIPNANASEVPAVLPHFGAVMDYMRPGVTGQAENAHGYGSRRSRLLQDNNTGSQCNNTGSQSNNDSRFSGSGPYRL